MPDSRGPRRRSEPAIADIAIRLTDVTKQFAPGDPPAVDQLSLEVTRGSIVALIGPSGCGKTTTLRIINRLIEPTSGRIEIDGVDVTSRPVSDLRRGIGYVIQQVGLFPHRSIADNIATVPRMLGWGKQETRARIEELTELVGLEHEMLDRYPDELSGGQQQRVGVARALAADPPVLLMDEPFGAVDPIVRGRLQDELLDLQEKVHKTIVLVTHDIDEALKLADDIALLNVGGILEQFASPDDLLRAPANEFVEQFVGEDRGVKRLQLTTVEHLPFERGPVVEAGASVTDARSIMAAHGTDWFGVVRDGRFEGWARGSDLDDGPTATVDRAPLVAPAVSLHPGSTLRNALEVIMSSDTSVAVIEHEGRFGGTITLEGIRRALGPQDHQP